MYLYRAVDSKGSTIEFYLSKSRNHKAAKRFFKKALRSFHVSKPRAIKVDKQGVIGRIPLSCVKKVQRFRAKEPKDFKRSKGDNWDNRNENRIKKMNRKFRKRNEKQKKMAKKLVRTTSLELKDVSPTHKRENNMHNKITQINFPFPKYYLA